LKKFSHPTTQGSITYFRFLNNNDVNIVSPWVSLSESVNFLSNLNSKSIQISPFPKEPNELFPLFTSTLIYATMFIALFQFYNIINISPKIFYLIFNIILVIYSKDSTEQKSLHLKPIFASDIQELSK
jgi:hypothetical protein